jgi:hypothetical protein
LLLNITLPVELGEDYIFNCIHQGDHFRVVVNKQFLDEFDFCQDRQQPSGKRLVKGLPWRVAPVVMLAWDAGRRPSEGVLRLLADDFSPARPTGREKRLRISELPTHDIPWDGSISLRRDDMYGDHGR